jgi:transcriptional regulator with XRE-family HTH domain
VKIGERLKKFRTASGLSQKQLAEKSGMSEPAIRNYELGNRYPNGKQLEKIAGALGINPLAIADPGFDSYQGLMHSLFQLEDLYGLKPQVLDGKIVLAFDVSPTDALAGDLRLWDKELEGLTSGATTQEEYDLWRYSFTRLLAERDKAARGESKKKRVTTWPE